MNFFVGVGILAAVSAVFFDSANSAPINGDQPADLDPSEVQRYLQMSKNYGGFVSFLHMLPKDDAEKYAAAVARSGVEQAAGEVATDDDAELEAEPESDVEVEEDVDNEPVENEDDADTVDETDEDDGEAEQQQPQEGADDDADAADEAPAALTEDGDDDEEAEEEAGPAEPEEDTGDDVDETDDEENGDDDGDDNENGGVTSSTESPSMASSSSVATTPAAAAAIGSTTDASASVLATPEPIPIDEMKTQLDKWFREQLQKPDTNEIDVLTRMLYYIASNRIPADQYQRVMTLLADVEPKIFDTLINSQPNLQVKAALRNAVDTIPVNRSSSNNNNENTKQKPNDINNFNNLAIFQEHI